MQALLLGLLVAVPLLIVAVGVLLAVTARQAPTPRPKQWKDLPL